jgi:hypothetical protein
MARTRGCIWLVAGVLVALLAEAWSGLSSCRAARPRGKDLRAPRLEGLR